MILTDKDIKEYVNDRKLIISGYAEENLTGISHELTIDEVYDENGKPHAEYELNSGEVVFIKTQEKLSIPDNILGRIAEKNSRIRQGLRVDGPHYQPGHVTYAFLRVQNLTSNIIVLSKNMKIAQIIFEQLTGTPDTPYSEQENKAFQNEVNYIGLGSYSAEYEKQTKKYVEKTKEDIEGISQKIYANVLTLMGVLVAVFALLSINYQAFSQATLDFKYILVMNLSLTLCIAVMMGLILAFINRAGNKWFLRIFIAILLLLSAAVIVVCMALF